jgi:hypothetical protein
LVSQKFLLIHELGLISKSILLSLFLFEPLRPIFEVGGVYLWSIFYEQNEMNRDIYY